MSVSTVVIELRRDLPPYPTSSLLITSEDDTDLAGEVRSRFQYVKPWEDGGDPQEIADQVHCMLADFEINADVQVVDDASGVVGEHR